MIAKYKLELSFRQDGSVYIENQTYSRGWGEWRSGYYETWQIFHMSPKISVIVFSIGEKFTYQECKLIAQKFVRGDYKFRCVNLESMTVTENRGIDDDRDL